MCVQLLSSTANSEIWRREDVLAGLTLMPLMCLPDWILGSVLP